MVDDSKGGKLTAEAIRRRIGLSTVAMPKDVAIGAKEMAMIGEAGITRIEISGEQGPQQYDHRNRKQVQEIKAECRKQGIRIVSVHGPSVPYDSPYEAVRRGAIEEAVASARAAEEMGAGIFVGHFDLDETSEKTIGEMLDQLDGMAIRLTVENGRDLRDFRAFADRIDSPRFGMVVDIGHTRDADCVNPFIKKERAREVMKVSGDRLFHLHLHDFTDTDHHPPFDGNVQWKEIFMALQDLEYKGEYMFEVAPRFPLADTIRKTAAFPDEFMKRYED